MIFKAIKTFDRGLTWAELAWRLFAFIVVIFGGTTTALLARASELFKDSSLFVLAIIGILTIFFLMLFFYLFHLSRKQAAEAQYLRSLSMPQSDINPLSDNFENKIIKLSDLYLPVNQIHEHKLFKNCQIMGPGTLVSMGGIFNNSGFIRCGDVILAPNETQLTGVIAFRNCTLDNCKLIDITIISDASPQNIQNFMDIGARVIVGDFKSKG